VNYVYDAVSAMQAYASLRERNDKRSSTLHGTDLFLFLAIIVSFLIWLPKKMFLDTTIATVTI